MSIQTIHVRTNPEYDVTIGPGLLGECGPRLKETVGLCHMAVVTDSNVAPLYLETVKSSLLEAGFKVSTYVFPAGESNKNFNTLSDILEFLAGEQLTRTDCVAALGGGVTGDMAGLAAALYLRGVKYVQLPTTLLAQVDSSVGGKVAIDLHAGKNLAGAFWQPSLVLIDPDCLSTLSDRTFSDGMAEVIKYGCIRDRAFFDLLDRCGGRAGVTEHIEEVIYTCCDIKRKVVLADERDTGERMVLNFGHTIGHAFELAGNYETWTHGQGVAAGMNWAAQIGVGLGVTPDIVYPIQNILKKYGLPIDIPCPWDTLTKAVLRDKKNLGGKINLIVLESLGHAIPYPVTFDQLLEQLEAMCGR